MASSKTRRQITTRDRDIFAALDKVPLAAEQLFTLSETFEQPFFTYRRIQRRLQELHDAGWLRRWYYARTTRGTPHFYYKLSPESYALLHGPDTPAPSKRYFTEMKPGRHYHTQALADFVVHTLVTAKHCGIELREFRRENSVAIGVDGEQLYADGAMQFRLPTGERFNYLIELDNSTETLRSPSADEPLERKLRLYDHRQDLIETRFRVPFVCTQSRQRRDNILATAAAVCRNGDRNLIYAVYLPDYLADPAGVAGFTFRNHRGEAVSLVSVEKQDVRQPALIA